MLIENENATRRLCSLNDYLTTLPSLRDRFFALLESELSSVFKHDRVRDWYSENKKISMLDSEVICALTCAAHLSAGNILEIGSYVGGSTVAMARGMSGKDRKLISLDKGGAHLSHPVLSTDDILRDFKSNLERFFVDDRVQGIEGNYGDDKIIARIATLLDGSKVGLLCIDADGHVDRAFNHIYPFLAPGAIVVIDDYASPPWLTDKPHYTKPIVDLLCNLGVFEKWGVLNGQTWIGCAADLSKWDSKCEFLVYLSRDNDIVLSGMILPTDTERFSGKLHAARLPNSFRDYADDVCEYRSPLMLLEDNTIIGPGHAALVEIRDYGRGRYCHWRESIWFSSSDNTDPLVNGKKYEVLLGEYRLRLVFA